MEEYRSPLETKKVRCTVEKKENNGMGMTLSMEEKVQTAAEAVIHAPATDETVTGRIVHAEDFDPLFAMSEEDCVEGFIKREMQRAGITEEQNLIPEDMLRRKTY